MGVDDMSICIHGCDRTSGSSSTYCDCPCPLVSGDSGELEEAEITVSSSSLYSRVILGSLEWIRVEKWRRVLGVFSPPRCRYPTARHDDAVVARDMVMVPRFL